MALVLFSIAAALLLIGAVLLIVGLRGRRVGDHPMCRRCGFDLFGRPAESSICPECGADLSRAKSTVVGIRRRKPWAVWTGSILMLPGVTALGIMGWGAARGIEWVKYEPVWILASDARGGDGKRRDAALAELLARQSAGKLTKDQIATLVNDGLNYQGRVDAAWSSGWGDLIQRARTAGQVSDEQWRRYAGQVVADSFGFVFRQRLSRTQEIPYQMSTGPMRVGGGRALFYAGQIEALVIDGQEFPLQAATMGGYPLSRWTGRRDGILASASLLRRLRDGPHRGYARLKLNLFESADVESAARALRPAGRPSSAPSSPGGYLPPRLSRRDVFEGESSTPVLATVEVRLPLEFDLLPEGQPPVSPVTDEQFRAGAERALTADNILCYGTRLSQCKFTCKNASPVDLAFNVFVRVRDERGSEREFAAGHVTLRRGTIPQPKTLYSVTDPYTQRAENAFTWTKGDVILRPSAYVAESSADATRYWAREIVIRDVSVVDVSKRVAATTRTTPPTTTRLGG